jgi:hypothetical protein
VSEDQVTLEYAATPRRRWRWRRWVAVVLVVAITVTVLHYREPIAQRARLLYWQHKCLTYTRPPGTPLMAWESLDADYSRNGSKLQPRYTLSPDCWRRFEAECWPVRATPLVQRAGRGPQTLFLHERTSKSGNRRLVRIETGWTNALAIDRGHIATVIRPGSLWREPKEVGPGQMFQYSGRSVEADLFFGQPDPENLSHFWFDFVVPDDGSTRAWKPVGSRRGTVDAWLNDDDTVTFKLRDPASTRGL